MEAGDGKKRIVCPQCHLEKKKYYSVAVLEGSSIPFVCAMDWMITEKDENGAACRKCFYPRGFSQEEIIDKLQRSEPVDIEDDKWVKFKVVLVGHKSANYRKLLQWNKDITRFFTWKNEPKVWSPEKKGKGKGSVKFNLDQSKTKLKNESVHDGASSSASDSDESMEESKKSSQSIINSEKQGQKRSMRAKDSKSSQLPEVRCEKLEARFLFSPDANRWMKKAAETGLSAEEVLDKYGPLSPTINRAGLPRLKKKLSNEKREMNLKGERKRKD